MLSYNMAVKPISLRTLESLFHAEEPAVAEQPHREKFDQRTEERAWLVYEPHGRTTPDERRLRFK